MKKKQKNKSVLGFKAVEILGHVFKIKETDKDEDLMYNRNVALGLCKYLEQEIVIDIRQSIQAIEQTLYHEILHAIDYISHNEQVMYDEETVNVLARGLMTMQLRK